MAIYSATFSGVAVTAQQDLFAIVAPATSRVVIREIRIGQYSDFGDAQAEILSIKLIRGATVVGSGGGAVTPANLSGVTGALAASSTVRVNDTTQASGGSPVTLISDIMNVAAGWWYYPPEEERLLLALSQRLVVSLASTPADSLTMSGTMIFEEIGQFPA